jgi:hypothetical protein
MTISACSPSSRWRRKLPIRSRHAPYLRDSTRDLFELVKVPIVECAFDSPCGAHRLAIAVYRTSPPRPMDAARRTPESDGVSDDSMNYAPHSSATPYFYFATVGAFEATLAAVSAKPAAFARSGVGLIGLPKNAAVCLVAHARGSFASSVATGPAGFSTPPLPTRSFS